MFGQTNIGERLMAYPNKLSYGQIRTMSIARGPFLPTYLNLECRIVSIQEYKTHTPVDNILLRLLF